MNLSNGSHNNIITNFTNKRFYTTWQYISQETLIWICFVLVCCAGVPWAVCISASRVVMCVQDFISIFIPRSVCQKIWFLILLFKDIVQFHVSGQHVRSLIMSCHEKWLYFVCRATCPTPPWTWVTVSYLSPAVNVHSCFNRMSNSVQVFLISFCYWNVHCIKINTYSLHMLCCG